MNENQLLDPMIEEEIKQEQMMAQVMDALENLEAENAFQFLEQYEEEYGEDEFWHIASIDIAEQKSDPETMLHRIHKAEKYGVDADELALRYGRFCYMVGRPEEALEYLAQCHFEQDSDQEFYKIHLEAYCHLIAQDYQSAVGKLEDLLLDAEDHRVVILASLCYKELGKMDRAWEYLLSGMESRSDFQPDYHEVFSAYDYDPEQIFAHSSEVFERLAGTKAETPTDTLPSAQDMRAAIQVIEQGGSLDEKTMGILMGILQSKKPVPLTYVLQALTLEQLGDEEEAVCLWRKTLEMPWDEQPGINVLHLYFRLLALEKLEHSPFEASEILWKMWQEQPDAAIRCQLLNYAVQHGYKKLLRSMTAARNCPSFETRKQECCYNMFLARAWFALDEYAKGQELVESMWDEMCTDHEYLLLAAGICVITGNEAMLTEIARRMMPHGVVAFHLLEYYDMKGMPAACREVQKEMKKALEDPQINVPEGDFYREFLRSFQKRHRR